MGRAGVHIITGFLKSGKTTLINAFLDNIISGNSDLEESQIKRILVINMEKGLEKVETTSKGNHPVEVIVKDFSVKSNEANEDIDEKNANKFNQFIIEANPDLILIEHNSMMDLEKLYKVLENRKLRKNINLISVNGIIDAQVFEKYAQNLGFVYTDPIRYCDNIIITNGADTEKNTYRDVFEQVKELNGQAEFFNAGTVEEVKQLPLSEILTGKTESFTASLDKITSILLLIGLAVGIGVINFIMIYEDLTLMDYDLMEPIGAFMTIFLGILIQALPFLLIGIIISAIIQVFVSEDFIARFFPKSPFPAMGIAVIAGVFFPICDCAIIPVIRRLIQKGVPLSAGMTFLAAAPVVDPVVILSTFYAFPVNPEVPITRVVIGVVIAVLLGIVFHFLPGKDLALRNHPAAEYCQCGFCTNIRGEKESLGLKVEGVFRHASQELFMVGKFLIIAAAFSAFLQVKVSPGQLGILTESDVAALLTMMVLAFLLSICSTSDAFIARNLAHQFDMNVVMGFMAFGAILDLKNLSLLLNAFNKRFVLKIIFTFSLICFVVLYVYLNLV